VQTWEARSQEYKNATLCSIARELGVDASQLRRWKLQKGHFKEFLSSSHGTIVNTGALIVHCGCKSCLNDIEENLLAFIWEQREQGIAVSIWMVITKTSQLLPAFWHKMVCAKDHAVWRFVASHGIVHCMHTHQSQKSIAAVQNRASDWIEQMCPLLSGGNQDHQLIINMDQTPKFFSMQPRTMLEASGA
jgi:hypothetical protein